MQILFSMEKFWKQGPLSRVFRFDEQNAAFELLETEKGEPSLLHGREQRTPLGESERPKPADASIEKNLARIHRQFRTEINPDIIIRKFIIKPDLPAFAVFVNGMASGDQISDFIIKPALANRVPRPDGMRISDYAEKTVFALQETEITGDWGIIASAILEGRTVVFLEGDNQTVIMDTRGFVSRSVETPQNETVVMGPKEAFTENLRTNVTLLRRIIKREDFVCEFRPSGGKNNVQIVVAYRSGIVNESLLLEVKKRLSGIDADMVLSSGTVEQLTESYPYCPLPQALTTERPDRAAAHIMQGHVAVLVEGAPFALVTPATLFTLMSSAEDTYMRQPMGTIVRLVRYLGAFISIVIPAYFIALCTHHQGMLSGEVLITIVSSRDLVFLPLPIEMIFLLLIFQLVREAGLSVPGVLGQSVGIIGGLILGQAAVSANIVSTVVLIVVALTGLGNFAIHDYATQLAASYFRLALVLASWAGGLLGLSAVLFLSVCYLASLKSFGVPFLSPVSPKTNAKGPMIVRGRLKNGALNSDMMNTARQQA